MDSEMQLYNVNDPFPKTDEEALKWLPKDANNLYTLYREMGMSIEKSLEKVLKVFVSHVLPEE